MCHYNSLLNVSAYWVAGAQMLLLLLGACVYFSEGLAGVLSTAQLSAKWPPPDPTEICPMHYFTAICYSGLLPQPEVLGRILVRWLKFGYFLSIHLTTGNSNILVKPNERRKSTPTNVSLSFSSCWLPFIFPHSSTCKLGQQVYCVIDVHPWSTMPFLETPCNLWMVSFRTALMWLTGWRFEAFFL